MSEDSETEDGYKQEAACMTARLRGGLDWRLLMDDTQNEISMEYGEHSYGKPKKMARTMRNANAKRRLALSLRFT
jgi:hypothetical protein